MYFVMEKKTPLANEMCKHSPLHPSNRIFTAAEKEMEKAREVLCSKKINYVYEVKH